MTEHYFTTITIIVAFASAAVSAFAIYYRKKQYEVTSKQYSLNALMEVFHLLNNETHRMARRAVYQYYREKVDGKSESEEVSQQIAMVRSDFDMIGTFIRNGLLSKDIFLDAYWDTTLVCWRALEDNIREERKLRQNQNYMANFEHLAAQAQLYKEKYLPRESAEPY